jgi:hypothetical protein
MLCSGGNIRFIIIRKRGSCKKIPGYINFWPIIKHNSPIKYVENLNEQKIINNIKNIQTTFPIRSIGFWED